MVTRSLLVGLALPALGGCGLVIGLEDHEPFPDERGGNGPTSTSTSGGGGAGGSGGTPGVDVLLIPDSFRESIGMYDPVEGAYLGDLVPEPTGTEPYDLVTPNDAVQGPDGRIYVSDQLSDVIVRFEPDGTFESIFADASDGLDNVRGIDFRDGDLFASVSPGNGMEAVYRFDLAGNRKADFVADDSDPFDVCFLPNGTMLLANIVDPDQVRLYDIDGVQFTEIVVIDFPQQIAPMPGGNFLVAGWTETLEFQIDGRVVRTLGNTPSASGVYPLDNGQWLVSSDNGVQEINPFSMNVTATVRVGGGFLKIERARVPFAPR
jgi:WD40 repeat protein